jgi:outer membrane receptor for ferrienterochelin and colicins
MTIPRYLVIIIIFLTFKAYGRERKSTSASKPSGMLQGRVFDSETKSPLPYTDVYLDSMPLGSSTNMDGIYKINSIPEGKYRLVAERIGYETYILNHLNITAGDTISYFIPLQPTSLEGEKITVTATLKEQTAQMSPASVEILNYKQIQTRPIFTFDQALENIPGISIYRSSGISVQNLSIRGSSDVAGGGIGNRVLLLLDGRPALTSDAGGAFWSLIPTNAVDHVEVVKGAFSSLYGSTAMGGVINVITRRPTYLSSTTIDAEYGLFEKPDPSIRFTDKTSLKNQVEITHSGNRGNFSYLINASRKQSDGYAENSAFEFYDVFAKIMYNIHRTRNLELTLGAGTAKNDYPHTWKNNLQPLQVREGYTDDRQKKRYGSIDLHYWAVPKPHLSYTSRFYLYRHISQSFFNENDPNLTLQGNQPFGLETNVDGNKLGNITQVTYSPNKNNNFVAGIDVQIDRVKSAPDTIMYGDHQVDNFAAYLQHEYKFDSHFTTTIGLRWDLNHLIGGNTLNQFSPKLAMVYRPRNNIAIRALFGQAFRSPSIAERFFRREISGGTLFKPNPDLKAERMDLSFETGLRWSPLSFANLDFALFYYHYRDMIYWVEISEEERVTYTLFQVRNLNKALIQGVDLSLNLDWKLLTTSIHYTYTDARDQSSNRTDDLLAYRVRHKLFLNSYLKWQVFKFNISGNYSSKVEEVFLYPLEAPDAYWVFNGKILFNLNSNIQFSIAVKNIFDAKYEELARYLMPGRNWMFGTKVSF